jgi:hypothetical protein
MPYIDRIITARGNIAWVVGSGLSQQVVPGVRDMVNLVAERWQRELRKSSQEFLSRLPSDGNIYQVAFKHLIGHCGSNVADEVVRDAVLRARRMESDRSRRALSGDPGECAALDRDLGGWRMTTGHLALGKLVRHGNTKSIVLTTNFDPLIEVAIGLAGGRYAQVLLSRDGSLSAFGSDAPIVVHLHGYWHRGHTLHTPELLSANRPALKASLRRVLEDKLVVVLGYAGWDDVLTGVLTELAADVDSKIEIRWTFYEADVGMIQNAYSKVIGRLEPALNGHVLFHPDIDAHKILPRLVESISLVEGIPRTVESDDIGLVKAENAVCSQRPVGFEKASSVTGNAAIGTVSDLSLSSTTLSRVFHTDQTGEWILETLLPSNAYNYDAELDSLIAGDSSGVFMTLHDPSADYLEHPLQMHEFTIVTALCVLHPERFFRLVLEKLMPLGMTALSSAPADMSASARLMIARAIGRSLTHGFVISIAIPRAHLSVLSSDIRLSYGLLTNTLLLPLLNAHQRRGAKELRVQIFQKGRRDKSLLKMSKAAVNGLFRRHGIADFSGAASGAWSEGVGQLTQFVSYAASRYYNRRDVVCLQALGAAVQTS